MDDQIIDAPAFFGFDSSSPGPRLPTVYNVSFSKTPGLQLGDTRHHAHETRPRHQSAANFARVFPPSPRRIPASGAVVAGAAPANRRLHDRFRNHRRFRRP